MFRYNSRPITPPWLKRRQFMDWPVNYDINDKIEFYSRGIGDMCVGQ
jgi:hypothetical protein